MTTRRLRAAALAFLAAAALGGTARGQQDFYSINAPRVSQRASVAQRIGLTDITIEYHRPMAKGRKIWGDVVPYGKVWRAGANENTTITFTDPVSVEGQPLPKGTYGLHMIPAEESWIVIFSKNSTSWGSFSYDQKEDALRVTVKPLPSEMHEALTYDFDDLKPDSVVATLRWERLAVPFRVSANVTEIALASIRQQLRSVPGFTWAGWNDAAEYCVQNKVNSEEALKWVDASIQAEERFENLETKSRLLAATGKAAEADAAMKQAISVAGPAQLHNYGRQLLRDKKTDEAVKIFQMNARKNPTVWFVYGGLARGQCATGDFKGAVKNMREALARAPESQKTYIQGLVDKLEKGQDIN